MTLAKLHLEATVSNLADRLRTASGHEAMRLQEEAAHLQRTLRQGGYDAAADEVERLVVDADA